MYYPKKYKVGVQHTGYAELRNIICIKTEKFKISKVFDIFKMLDFLFFKIFKKTNQLYHNFFYSYISFPNVDIYHFFNTIASTSKPWIVTFETDLPRYNRHSKKGICLLVKDNCKRIIAFNKFAYDKFSYYLNEFPEYKSQILNKTIILHPPQIQLVNAPLTINESTIVNFVFLGRDFFRKGGAEVLNAIERLDSEGYQFRLYIISSISTSGWLDDHITTNDIDSTKKRISNNSKITHYQSLSNTEVLSLIQKCHVSLLPSWHETYGYSILESQSCGCPVVTTDIPPFDEINPITSGWRVNVPVKQFENTHYSNVSTTEDRLSFQQILSDNLYLCLKNILDNPIQINEKSKHSLELIEKKHNISDFSTQLEQIYTAALTKI